MSWASYERVVPLRYELYVPSNCRPMDSGGAGSKMEATGCLPVARPETVCATAKTSSGKLACLLVSYRPLALAFAAERTRALSAIE